MTYERDNNDANQSIPGGVRLKVGIIREVSSIIPLCLHTLVEPNVGDSDPEPSYETRNRCHVGEPGKNPARTPLDTHEAKERKACIETNRNDGQSVRQSFKEYFGCISRYRQTVLIEKKVNIP